MTRSEGGSFDEAVASTYDADAGARFDPAVVDPMVDLLAEMAADGGALELGVGTGRIALPLAHRGIRVEGIDLSAAMVRRLRAKPDGERVGVTVGDMTTTRVPGTFQVVYLVDNTIMNIVTQAGQVRCFRNAAAHLQPGGRFLVEVMVPDLRRLPPGEIHRPFHVSESRWGFDEYDVAEQRLTSHHFRIRYGLAEARAVPFRYVWPAELDLMAELAGMRLEARWENWHRAPFTADSRGHVSVWRNPPTKASA